MESVNLPPEVFDRPARLETAEINAAIPGVPVSTWTR